MIALAKIALYAWVPFVLLVFAVMKPRRAVIFAYVGGWLFLPMLSINFSGIPDLTKITASSFGVLLGAGLFDYKTLLKFRPSLYDLPIVAWCVSPFFTSIVNDLGVYDGVSSIVQQLGLWGIPYFIGRVYFADMEGFTELGIGIIIGALVYLPFCYLEMVISPLLHKYIYGFVQHSIAQAKRWGAFRPMVFMQSSLALAMYMTTAVLIAFWLWVTKAQKKIMGMPILWVVGILVVTQILCKTMAATAFMFMGIAALYWIKWMGKSGGLIAGLPILALAIAPAVYMYARASELVNKDTILTAMGTFTSDDRLVSLEVRLKAEDLVTAQALSAPNPWWGWGKWDPNDTRRTPWRVYMEYEKKGLDGMPTRIVRDIAPTDGLWIITMGQYGLIGVTALTLTIILPAFVLWKRVPLKFWAHPAVATAAAMAILLLLHMIDNLLNGMINSLYLLALGGLCGIVPIVRKTSRLYGPAAAIATLNQHLPGSAGLPSPYGAFPVQPPPGQGPAYGLPTGFPPVVPAAYSPAQPGGGAFPSLAGLQAGPIPQPRRRR
ncbi:hypothetical protein [Humisphaera borealis]|uniref:O-antigen ligase domain-containing protein n=1 Tax=Humisphaera borealis TaxID=2807512 RepID=A0A7M2WR25_9BACT|nr:hypothetical protein [Humisphaera borealis]QOV87958.1 hypothetical protein IPV69_17010 [Humisphaera borealis]